MAAGYRPISDYALIGDCRSAALVSSQGSIDWCCLPRFDSSSTFGRLLDTDRGGYYSLAPVDGEYSTSRRYLDETLVLETSFEADTGGARLIDCFAMPQDDSEVGTRRLLRVLEGVRGSVEFEL